MRKLIFAEAFVGPIFLALTAASLLSGAQQATPSPAVPSASATPAQSSAGPVHENVSYGTAGNETLLLDIFEPAGNSDHPRPAVILIHGGGWTSFDKSTMRTLAQFLARSGFVAVPVDYRLFHDGVNRWPAQLDDAQRSVRWLRANAAKYNVAPNQIGAYGHSAGAHLAALLGMIDTRDNSDPALAKYSSKVQAVVDSSGPTEFTGFPKDSDEDKFFSSFSAPATRLTRKSGATPHLSITYRNPTRPSSSFMGRTMRRSQSLNPRHFTTNSRKPAPT